MRFFGYVGGLWPMLLVAGCVAPAGPAPEGVASVRAEPRPGVVAPIARGEATLVVRAVPAGASGQELLGAACRAESDYITADFRSPAQLLMPDFGEGAPVPPARRSRPRGARVRAR